MQPPPPGWPRLSASLYYPEAKRAIEWLCRAFGFEAQLVVEGEDGAIHHSQLVLDGALIMVSETRPDRMPFTRTPGEVGGGNTMNLALYVDDVEAHCRRAREAGARVVSEPTTTDYGEGYWSDRGYCCEDVGGHHWWFLQRLHTDG